MTPQMNRYARGQQFNRNANTAMTPRQPMMNRNNQWRRERSADVRIQPRNMQMQIPMKRNRSNERVQDQSRLMPAYKNCGQYHSNYKRFNFQTNTMKSQSNLLNDKCKFEY